MNLITLYLYIPNPNALLLRCDLKKTHSFRNIQKCHKLVQRGGFQHFLPAGSFTYIYSNILCIIRCVHLPGPRSILFHIHNI